MKNIQKPRKDQIHVVSMSGGKDSTATALVAMEMGYDFVGAFADTGNENEITYEYIDFLERKLDIKIHKVRSNYDYIEYCKTKNKVGRPEKEKDFYFEKVCPLSEGACE